MRQHTYARKRGSGRCLLISEAAHRRSRDMKLMYWTSSESKKEFAMGDIYAMQRANGDWFTETLDGRLRVPLFHSVHDALMSRLRNFAMLLFKPVTLDSNLLEQFISKSGTAVDFCLIEDPFVSLKRGERVELRQLSSLLGSNAEMKRETA